MDIQNLIKLAHQADLEGNYRVADKLTQRAIREAIFGFGRRGRGTSGGGGVSGGFFGSGGKDFSMHGNTAGGHSGGGAGGPSTVNTGGGNTGGGGAGGRGGRGGDATNRNKGGGGGRTSPELAEARRKERAGEPLSELEQSLVDKANKRNERNKGRAEQKAKGGPGGGGGGGGRGGDLSTGGQSVDTSGGGSSAAGGALNQTNNARYKTRDIGGSVTGLGTAGTVALATVPTAILAALGAYGMSVMNGKVVDQRGNPVPPQNIPPAVQSLMSGGAKANQLALRTQANQMGNAQAAQSFIEDRRANPAFKTAQDFYNDAKNKGYNQSMINQITALAKAEGYPDLSPYTN